MDATNEKTLFMMQTGLFRGFTKKECDYIVNFLNPIWRDFFKGDKIVFEGEKQEFIGIIRSGQIAAMKFYEDGNVHIFYTVSELETVGLQNSASFTGISPLTYEALTDTRVLLFPYQRIAGEGSLNDAMRAKFMENTSKILANHSIKNLRKIEILSTNSVRGRIMIYLEILSRKYKSDEFTLHMTQEQMANYLCVNRSVLSAELNAMRREGIIDFQRRKMKLLRK